MKLGKTVEWVLEKVCSHSHSRIHPARLGCTTGNPSLSMANCALMTLMHGVNECEVLGMPLARGSGHG